MNEDWRLVRLMPFNILTIEIKNRISNHVTLLLTAMAARMLSSASRDSSRAPVRWPIAALPNCQEKKIIETSSIIMLHIIISNGTGSVSLQWFCMLYSEKICFVRQLLVYYKRNVIFGMKYMNKHRGIYSMY